MHAILAESMVLFLFHQGQSAAPIPRLADLSSGRSYAFAALNKVHTVGQFWRFVFAQIFWDLAGSRRPAWVSIANQHARDALFDTLTSLLSTIFASLKASNLW